MLDQGGTSVLQSMTFAVQIALGVVFFASAVPKARHPKAFAETVADYRVLPKGLAPLVAYLIILTEAFMAAALTLGISIRFTGELAGLLLVVFAIAVGTNLIRRRSVTCGCFGDEDEEISAWTLARIAVLFSAVTVLVYIEIAWQGAVRVIQSSEVVLSNLADLAPSIFIAAALVLGAKWVFELPVILPVLRVLVQTQDARDSLDD